MPSHEKSQEQIKRDLEALELSKAKRYEVRDVNVPFLSKVIAGFFGFATLCVILAFAAMFLVYDKISMVGRPPTTPGPNQANYVKPPLAPLQSGPEAKKDIADLRHQEEAKVNTYAEHEGRIQIPVDRAIEILAERGLAQPAPVAPGMTPAQQPVGTGTPTDVPPTQTR